MNIIKKILFFIRNFVLGLFCIICVIQGLLFISDSIIYGILIIIGGLLIFPIFVNFFYEKIKNYFNINKKTLYCIGVIFILVSFEFNPYDTIDKNYLNENEIKEDDKSQTENNWDKITNKEDAEQSDSIINSNSNTNNSSTIYSNIEKLSSIQKENFIVALKECEMDPNKVKNISKLNDWSNGSRFSFSYNNDILYLYINDDDTINSINLSLGDIHIYDEKYESLNYNNFSISSDILFKLKLTAENYISAALKDPNSAKYNWTSYQRTNQYYAISGTVSANNSFGQKTTSDTYIEFEYNEQNLSIIYTLIDGKSTGKKVVPEIKRIERKGVDNSNDNLITLKDGIVGKYGKYDVMDGKKYLRFYVPVGKYKVKALVKNSMFYVESIALHKEDGYDTPTTYNTFNLTNANDTQTIEVESGQCISLVIGTKIELTKID